MKNRSIDKVMTKARNARQNGQVEQGSKNVKVTHLCGHKSETHPNFADMQSKRLCNRCVDKY